MKSTSKYTGIDYFRILAAIMIVAIHTSPLLSFSETSDFILTRVISRTAVPFFFLTSGFFLFTDGLRDWTKLKILVRKTAVLYGIAIVLYLPINFYNGYFYMDQLWPNMLKDFVFDGTLYHLWYLPASMLGAIIAWLLIKKLGYQKAFILTLLLYALGLLGDSYYGFTKQIPFLKDTYNLIFHITEYTRNGIFFAPIFFVMGGCLSYYKKAFSFKVNVIGLTISMLGMTAEGLLLHYYDLQKHDSMYLMLLPSMVFLFQTLLYWKGQRVPALRTVAMLIYIIHPMMIVLVRVAAKVLRMERVFIDNSLVHFFAVAISSIGVSYLFLILQNSITRYTKKTELGKERAWLEINLKHLEHNAKVLKELLPKNGELMAVVKADAYGHGAVVVSQQLNKVGINTFAVATIEEGIELRKHGVRGDILILGYTELVRAKDLKKYKLMQTIVDYPYAKALNECGQQIKVHIKIDTGMHRLGVDCNQVKEVIEVLQLEHLDTCGIFTHLCASDSHEKRDVSFTLDQIDNFYRLIQALKEKNIPIPKLHIQSSYGLLNYPELNCDYVRLGIALYGSISSWGDTTKVMPDLRPVLALKAHIALIKNIKAGEGVGYSRSFVAERDSRIAVVPIGYADGLPRNLSCNKAYGLLHGQRVPIIGRICMDQLVIDITEVAEAGRGDTITLIGKDKENEITAVELANSSNSITNEVFSRLGQRLHKVYLR